MAPGYDAHRPSAAGTVTLSVSQRAREFASLRAIGATPRQIHRAVTSEALLVAPLAGIIGCLPGMTGEAPYVPPLLYGSFAAAAGGLTLLAVTLPARAALRRWS
ncbi:ABC transporter permease [Streptomyces sp. NBC_00184]|uniref:ABC transporter permease n=1 Tax=Streptomyces sp. NPDC050273 TaxID=3154933 RepID=UPI002E2DA495|nr:ABC transporter permease [Streptomyces sp. NBC_00184]